jgi:uncharacterized protein (DUF58 family)
VLGAGIALTISWIALGEIELLGAGAAMLLAVAIGLLVTNWTRPSLQIHRQLRASAVHEGERAAVALNITNRRWFPVFNLTVSDGVGNLGTARFTLSSLKGQETATASYQIVCRPRGVYRIGPVKVTVRDPLGLASSDQLAGEFDQLIVYPAIEPLSGYPAVRGRDPSQSASRPEHSQHGGEDFYALRAYQDGDDLRRVHWASSARRDELMIRQMETPWQSRALIFFDARRQRYEDTNAFERAVRGAASVVAHLGGGGFAADLWAGGGLLDVREPAVALEALARIQPFPAIDLKSVATRLRRTGPGGALVLISGRPDDELVGVMRMLASQYRVAVLLAATGEPTNLDAFQRMGVRTVATGPGQIWAPGWNEAMGRVWAPASAG